MSIVLWSTAMSLDGFVAGPDDAMEWVFRYSDDSNEMADELISGTGAILSGRRSYDVSRKPGQVPEATEAFAGAWHGPEFVLTHNPPTDDPERTFLSGDITEAVRTALAAAGDGNLNVLGTDVARQCLAAGLVDEIWIMVLPVLLGAGIRLFGGAPVDLEPISVGRSGMTTNLRYRVTKQVTK